MSELLGPFPILAEALEAVEAGDPDRAVLLCEAEATGGNRDPTFLTNYGVLLWRLFEFQRAEEIFSQVITDQAADPLLLRRIAHCHFEVGRFGDAANVMREAESRCKQSNAELLNTWAWTLERDNQIVEARHQAEAALAVDPQYAPAVRLLAHIDKRSNELEQAAARLQQHLARHPSSFDWGLQYELAGVLDRLGQYDDAWRTLSTAKTMLRDAAQSYLLQSKGIRARQWEVARRVSDSDLRRWRAMLPELAPTRKICFLTGFPRSGTTLLEQMIATHPEAIGTDETGILSSQFVAPIVWKAADAAEAIVELRSFDAEQLLAGRNTFFHLTASYLQQAIPVDRLLVEKNPLATPDLPLFLRLFPEASFLIALRDPRDVVLSYLFTMVPLNWSSAPAIDVGEACQFYAETMRHWLWWRGRLPWRWHELRYEQMIAAPRQETERVADFLGLTWQPSMLDEKERSARKAVRTPTYDDITKPLYTRAIGRWRHYAKYLEPGLHLLEPFIHQFGY